MNNFAKFLILFFTCSTLNAMENNQQKTLNIGELQEETLEAGFILPNTLIEIETDSEPKETILDHNQLNYMASVMVERNKSCVCGFNTLNKEALKDHLQQCEKVQAHFSQAQRKRKAPFDNEGQMLYLAKNVQDFYKAKRQRADKYEQTAISPKTPDKNRSNKGITTNIMQQPKDVLPPIDVLLRFPYPLPPMPAPQTESDKRALSNEIQRKWDAQIFNYAKVTSQNSLAPANLSLRPENCPLQNSDSGPGKCVCGQRFSNKEQFSIHAQDVLMDPVRNKYHCMLVMNLKTSNKLTDNPQNDILAKDVTLAATKPIQNIITRGNFSQSTIEVDSTQLVEHLADRMVNENRKCYCGYYKDNKAQLKFHILSHLISKKNELDIEIQNQAAEMIKESSPCYCGFKSQNKTLVFIHLMIHTILS